MRAHPVMDPPAAGSVAAVPRIVVLGTSGAGKTTVARRLLPHGNRERWRLSHATWVV
jgi:guanylate kinase